MTHTHQKSGVGSPRYRRMVRQNLLLIAIPAMLALAWMRPDIGVSINSGDILSSALIMGIFFLSGLSLERRRLRRTLFDWRLHLVFQAFIFIINPILTSIVLHPFRQAFHPGVIVGFQILSVLPTTISTCVVLTQVSGGNTALSFFNSIISNMAGVLVSPILLMLILSGADIDVAIQPLGLFRRLLVLTFVPFVVGQFLQWCFFRRNPIRVPGFNESNSLAVAMLSYLAFCGFLNENERPEMAISLFPLVGLMLVIQASMLSLSLFGGRLLGWSRENVVALIFCAPQKTIGLGLPIVAACLQDQRTLLVLANVILVIYHPLQLTIGAIISRLLQRRAAAREVPVNLATEDGESRDECKAIERSIPH